jgi:hypothetical protein
MAIRGRNSFHALIRKAPKDLQPEIRNLIETVRFSDDGLQVIHGDGVPTVASVASGRSLVYVDDTNSKVYLTYNLGGTLKKVELT